MSAAVTIYTSPKSKFPNCYCEAEAVLPPNTVSKNPEVKPTLFSKIMDILERITLVALSIFSFIVSPAIYISLFAIGTVVGIIRFWNDRSFSVKPSGTIGCSQGFLEILTGVRLPQPLSLLANVGIILDHLLCHRSLVYAALTGVSVGSMIGKNMVGCAQKVTALPACSGLNNMIASCSQTLTALMS